MCIVDSNVLTSDSRSEANPDGAFEVVTSPDGARIQWFHMRQEWEMEDKLGYLKLKVTLDVIADKLIKEDKQELANEVIRATKFYGGMPSEFMGESWLILKKVLENKNKISDDAVGLVEEAYKQVVEGFESVWQKLPK